MTSYCWCRCVLHAQILFGSFPIARCRDPFAVLAYLAAHAWPRLHIALGPLRKVEADEGDAEEGSKASAAGAALAGKEDEDEAWSPLGEHGCGVCQLFPTTMAWHHEA
jgi:hypothetical protein